MFGGTTNFDNLDGVKVLFFVEIQQTSAVGAGFSVELHLYTWTISQKASGSVSLRSQTHTLATQTITCSTQRSRHIYLATCEQASMRTDSKSLVNSGPFFLLFWMTSLARYRNVSFLLLLAAGQIKSEELKRNTHSYTVSPMVNDAF